MLREKAARILIPILLLALSAAAWYNYRDQQQSTNTLTGTIEATKADITAKNSGYIEDLYIKEGDTVSKGTPAARLTRKDLAASLLRDQSAYAQAQSKLQELETGTRSGPEVPARGRVVGARHTTLRIPL